MLVMPRWKWLLILPRISVVTCHLSHTWSQPALSSFSGRSLEKFRPRHHPHPHTHTHPPPQPPSFFLRFLVLKSNRPLPSRGLPLKTSNGLFIGRGRRSSTRSTSLSCTFLLCPLFVLLPSHALYAQTPVLPFFTRLPLSFSLSPHSLYLC